MILISILFRSKSCVIEHLCSLQIGGNSVEKSDVITQSAREKKKRRGEEIAALSAGEDVSYSRAAALNVASA